MNIPYYAEDLPNETIAGALWFLDVQSLLRCRTVCPILMTDRRVYPDISHLDTALPKILPHHRE